jgi:hypothetical protein
MMMRSLISMLLMFTAVVAGARTLTVEAVVSPAWVEHAGGAREPLVPGTVLRDGDRVLTGSGARALLRMAEGSAVKKTPALVLIASAIKVVLPGALSVVRSTWRRARSVSPRGCSARRAPAAT